MTALVPVALALAAGWGLWRLVARRPGAPGALAGSALAAVVTTVAWMACLDVIGIRWSPAWLLLPLLPAVAAGVTHRGRPALRRGKGAWPGVAIAAVAARAVTVAVTPAFGWDFRYIWGLKARAHALAGGHDMAWLAWPGHHFAHPSYPPAWSDLLAGAAVLGVPVDAAAAAWQAVLIAALAALCWEATAGCPAWVRALAATAAAWSPVIGDPLYSGYAEPLLAFLAAAGLTALAGAARGETGAATTLAAATAGLALTKNEGAAFALGLVAAVALAGGVRRAWPALATFAAALLAWRVALPAGLAARDSEFAPSLAGAVRHLSELPAAVASALVKTPALGLVILVWLACLAAWWSAELRGVRVTVAVWALAVVAAYLSTTEGLAWHLATSADRVLAAPLPGVLALVLAARFSGPAPAGGRSGPAPSRGGSPSA